MSKLSNLGFEKDMLVYKRKGWGDDAGQIDEDHLYKIKSIGSKRCTLVNIDKKTGEPRWNRGTSCNLVEKERAAELNQRGWGRYYWEWKQILVPVGNAGWDADFNF